MVGDFWAIYRLDVRAYIRDNDDLGLIVELVGRLTHEERSLYRLKQAGIHERYLGWNLTHTLLADLIDALNWNTSVTSSHGSKSRPKKPTPYPRPTDTREFRPKSVKEMKGFDLRS